MVFFECLAFPGQIHLWIVNGIYWVLWYGLGSIITISACYCSTLQRLFWVFRKRLSLSVPRACLVTCKSAEKRHLMRICIKWLCSLIATLNNDDDGSENVAKKITLSSFKLNRFYLDPLNMSNAGDFSWSWILKDFIQVKKKRKENSSCVYVLHKTSN